jgi:hypothetical protein
LVGHEDEEEDVGDDDDIDDDNTTPITTAATTSSNNAPTIMNTRLCSNDYNNYANNVTMGSNGINSKNN